MDEQEVKDNTLLVAIEYISTAICCSKLLWIKNLLEDYDVVESKIPIFRDNKTAINLSKNPILHFHDKHIEIKHHFIRDHVKKGTVDLQYNLAKC